MLETHPAVADLFEAAGVLGGEGFLREPVDLGGRGPGSPQPVADGAHEGVAVAAAQRNSDLWIKRSHRGLFHIYNVRRAKNVSPRREFPGQPPYQDKRDQRLLFPEGSERWGRRMIFDDSILRMSLRGHLWTIAPRLRHRLRPPRLPESRPWEVALRDYLDADRSRAGGG